MTVILELLAKWGLFGKPWIVPLVASLIVVLWGMYAIGLSCLRGREPCTRLTLRFFSVSTGVFGLFIPSIEPNTSIVLGVSAILAVVGVFLAGKDPRIPPKERPWDCLNPPHYPTRISIQDLGRIYTGEWIGIVLYGACLLDLFVFRGVWSLVLASVAWIWALIYTLRN